MFCKSIVKLFSLFFILNNLELLSSQIDLYQRWAICSPGKHLATTDIGLSAYQYLQQMAERAHECWKSEADVSKRVVSLDDVFCSVDRKFLIKLIDEILNSPVLLEEVTKNSYKNITGFLKIVLMSGGKDSWKLRLHVWEQKEKEYPHNHKWDFFSKIMTGYLVQDMYEQTTPESVHALEYTVREPVSLMPLLPNGQKPCPCRDHYVLAEKEEISQTVWLQQINKNIIGVGESYFMTHDIIHTINPGKHAISFVFTSENVTKNSEVFVPVATDNENLTKHAPSVTQTELIQELLFIKCVLSRISLSSKYLPELIHPNHGYFSRNSNMFQYDNWRNNVLTSQTPSYVAQLTQQEKNQFKVTANEQGEILVGGQPVTAQTDYLFVLMDDVMYASPKDFAHASVRLICHTSFTDYAAVDAAGLLRFNNQRQLTNIEAYSGHYEPSIDHMVIAYRHLADHGINVSLAEISKYHDRV